MRQCCKRTMCHAPGAGAMQPRDASHQAIEQNAHVGFPPLCDPQARTGGRSRCQPVVQHHSCLPPPAPAPASRGCSQQARPISLGPQAPSRPAQGLSKGPSLHQAGRRPATQQQQRSQGPERSKCNRTRRRCPLLLSSSRWSPRASKGSPLPRTRPPCPHPLLAKPRRADTGSRMSINMMMTR